MVLPRSPLPLRSGTLCIMAGQPSPMFGAALQAIRVEKGISLDLLSAWTGLTLDWLLDAEQERCDPTWDEIVLVAQGLDVSVYELALRAEAEAGIDVRPRRRSGARAHSWLRRLRAAPSPHRPSGRSQTPPPPASFAAAHAGRCSLRPTTLAAPRGRTSRPRRGCRGPSSA